MTRKHFKAIAKCLKDLDYDELNPELSALYENVCFKLADVLNLFNPRFDRDKFLRACGFTHFR